MAPGVIEQERAELNELQQDLLAGNFKNLARKPLIMENQELKFLLILLNKPNHRSPIGQVKIDKKNTTSERDKVCRKLQSQELIAYTEEISQFKIAPPGKALLKSDSSDLPITAQELKIIQACEQEATAPSKINISPAKKRNELIEKLETQGLIEIESKKIKEVWLTEKGQEYLAKEYHPSGGGNITLSKNMMAVYLKFLRKYLLQLTTQESDLLQIGSEKPTDEEIFQTIISLDRELGTENYLPIFYLREKYQPPLTRDELDSALYRLQKQDKLELSSLVESVLFTEEQIKSGIPQRVGGCLFFLRINLEMNANN
jgi:hypothetical protein